MCDFTRTHRTHTRTCDWVPHLEAASRRPEVDTTKPTTNNHPNETHGDAWSVSLRETAWRHGYQPNISITFSNGYLGYCNDEERSEMRYVMRIAELSESSNL